MTEVVITGAARTPVGAFNGALSSVPASYLGSIAIKEAMSRAGVSPEDVDEAILGQILIAAQGQNPARQAAVEAGIPVEKTAYQVNQLCGSGLRTVALGSQAIKTGDSKIVVAGGQESMSQAPHVLPNSRNGQRMGNWSMVDTMIKDGLWDAFNDYHMGITAENIVEKYGISRDEQDEFAAASQQKAAAARSAGYFDGQIVPVSIPQRKGDPIVVDRDEGPRDGVTAESLGNLRAAFKKDGTVTAGNASSLNDGAAAVMVCSAEKAKELGLTPIATIKAHANAGVDPTIMGTGPIPASQRCLKLAGWSVDDLDLVEANEAFAAQAISVNRDMGWDTSKVNVNGGAIALGHPIGASGCRILVSLLHEMVRRDAHKGLATLCIGGGMGVALAVER